MTEIVQRPADGFGEGAIEFVGLHDGAEAGHEVGLPFKVKVEGLVYQVLAGSDLRVDPAHRRSNLGMLLPEAMRTAAPDKIAVAGAVSRMAQPVYEFLGFSNFQMPRYAVPLHGRRHFGLPAGAAIALYRCALRAVAAAKLRGLTFSRVGPDDAEGVRCAAELIATDRSVCAEVHDEAWIARHLREAFSAGRPLELMLVRKGGKAVGVTMTKLRHKAQVRNLKDVRLGSVVEWQFADEMRGREGWALVKTALDLSDEAEIVEIATADKAVQRLLRRLGWRRAGACDFMIGVADDSPLAGNAAVTKMENWRLRPAMGDNGLG